LEKRAQILQVCAQKEPKELGQVELVEVAQLFKVVRNAKPLRRIFPKKCRAERQRAG